MMDASAMEYGEFLSKIRIILDKLPYAFTLSHTLTFSRLSYGVPAAVLSIFG